ncbi:MAG: Trk system potassium transport protein TrkA [Acidimicrobiales bacterium]|nr:MAG: Trk system potassium transport protein TrkA [Acidimicrobiales bacterium]
MGDDQSVRIIVVGAGEVGTYVADRLSNQGHDVTIIEVDGDRGREIQGVLDVEILHGSGTDPDVLDQARVGKADLLVAVTKHDEVNILSALMARKRGVTKTIVRVESRSLRRTQAAALFEDAEDHLVIDPDDEVAQAVQRLIRFTGVLEYDEMAGGEVVVLTARLPGHASLVGKSLRELGRELEPDWGFIVGSITRREAGEDREHTVIPRGDWTLRESDLLTVVCKRENLDDVTSRMGMESQRSDRVLLLGGGRTAEILAESLLVQGQSVGVIERDESRAQELSRNLDRALIYHGDITDALLLDEAEVARQDVVVALTGEDDANVLACLYAKSAGQSGSGSVGSSGPETIAVIHRLQLLDLLEAHMVDATISPRTATANSVLRFVRGEGDTVAAVATSLHGDAEVLEFAVAPGCPCDGKTISELGLHEDVLMGAIVRDGKAQIARGRSTLRARDHVIAVVRPGQAAHLSSLFG